MCQYLMMVFDHRRSDRINVSRFHLNQTNDINQVMRALDEADYPDMSYDIASNQWYFGIPQKRADQVPDASEYTLMGNNLIDGDWYVLNSNDTAYQFKITLLPSNLMSGRLDFYSLPLDSLSNASLPDTSINWGISSDTVVIHTSINNFASNAYYLRCFP